jgi:hypothetical protein
MHAAMPASSIKPYMWIVSGPSSSVPDEGDGMEAKKATGYGFCPRAPDGVRTRALWSVRPTVSGAPT